MFNLNKKSWIAIFFMLILTSTGCVPNNYSFNKEIGKPGSNSCEFTNPTDLDIDKNGNLVVADSGNARYQIISTNGELISQGGEFGTEGKKLQSISGIGVDREEDTIWVCDQKGNKILKYDDGQVILKIDRNMKYPKDVAVDKNHNIYVLMTKKSEIYKFDSNGQFIKTIGGENVCKLLFPTSIIVNNDIIYITDVAARKIAKLDLEGNLIEEIKSKGEYEAIKGPSNIYIDEKGNMYILDLGEVPVVILSPDGKNLISQIGQHGNAEGFFLNPLGIVAKSDDDIYILDNSRNTILNFNKKQK